MSIYADFDIPQRTADNLRGLRARYGVRYAADWAAAEKLPVAYVAYVLAGRVPSPPPNPMQNALASLAQQSPYITGFVGKRPYGALAWRP